MVIRKRKNPSPDFNLPPPFQPMTGEHAKLLVEGKYPYCALMQVVEEDTHCNYVVCRGWDPRSRVYLTETPGFPVAKPYSRRMKGLYRVGEVYPALLPLPAGFIDGDKTVPRIGQNAGRTEGTITDCRSHPEDLDQEVVLLQDDDGTYVNWMFLDQGPPRVYFELQSPILQFESNIVDAWQKTWDPSDSGGDGGFTFCGNTIKVGDLNEVGHEAGIGGYGSGVMYPRLNDPYWVCVIDDLCCPGDEQGLGCPPP